MWHYLKLFCILVIAGQRCRMQHRFNFMMWVLIHCVVYASTILSVWVLTNRFGSIAGWNFAQLAMLLALMIISHGLAIFFGISMIYLQSELRSGQFDRYLVRPITPLFHIMSERFEPNALGHFIGGFAALFLASRMAGVEWSAVKIIFTIFAVAGGAMIQLAVMIISAAVGFWTLDTATVFNAGFYPMRNFSYYPLRIFNSAVKFALVFLMPLAFANYFPAQYLLGKADFAGFPPFIQYLSFPVGLLCMVIAVAAWQCGLARYESTGS